mgnify:CR=1 FL=1
MLLYRKALAALTALTMLATLPLNGYVAGEGGNSGESAAGTTYYVDSAAGNDSNSGTSENAAWSSLDKVSQTAFRPGDRILLKADSIWNGQQLYLEDSGTAALPIIVDVYGSGDKPIINGLGLTQEKYNATRVPVDYQGTYSCATVLVKNAQYVEINNLKVTNKVNGLPEGANNTSLMGICALNENAGVLHHIHIKDCEVFDVNSFVPADDSRGKSTGGIIARVSDGGNAYQQAVASGWHDLQIVGNYVHDVGREGIYLHTDFCARPLVGGGEGSQDMVFSHDVQISNNIVGNIKGDGIVVIATDNALVEHNYVENCGLLTMSTNTYHAGVWVWDADYTVFQFNEVAGTKGVYPHDGQAFDFDYGTSGNLYQYNFTHDNEGGWLLNCAPDGASWGLDDPYGNYNQKYSDNNVARYNISQDDGWKNGAQLIEGYGPIRNLRIHNNTFYMSKTEASGSVLAVAFETNRPAQNVYIYNNIFYTKPVETKVTFLTQNNVHYFNNCYYGATPSGKNWDRTTSVQADPLFAGTPGTATGLDAADCYKLSAASPCIGAGIDADTNPTLFPAIINSSECGNPDHSAVGPIPQASPEISAALFDYYGNAVTSTNTPNIGADSFNGV